MKLISVSIYPATDTPVVFAIKQFMRWFSIFSASSFNLYTSELLISSNFRKSCWSIVECLVVSRGEAVDSGLFNFYCYFVIEHFLIIYFRNLVVLPRSFCSSLLWRINKKQYFEPIKMKILQIMFTFHLWNLTFKSVQRTKKSEVSQNICPVYWQHTHTHTALAPLALKWL